MPERPQGKDKYEYEKGRPRHQFKSIGFEEELGDMHLATENYSVALEYYEKSLQKTHVSSTKSSDLVRIYQKISDCYRKKGLLREAMNFLQSAQSHCEEGNEIGRGTIAYRRGIILYERGDVQRALRQACEAYRILRMSDEHREVANTQLLIANCYSRLGRIDEAEQYYLDALSSFRRIEDTVGEAYVLNNLGLFHKNACRWGRSLSFLNRALEICDELGLTQHRVRVKLNLGIVYLKKRDFAQAVSTFTSARSMAKRIGDDLKYTKATLMLGVAETRLGNLAAAEKHLLEARVLAERRSYGREVTLADEFIGDLMVERGDLSGALQNYTVALSGAKKIYPEGDVVAEVLRRLAQVFLLQRKPQDALSTGERALQIAEKCGEVHEIGFIKRTIGLAYALLKKTTEAEKFITAGVATFVEVNNPYEANRTNYLMGECLLKQKDRTALLKARKLLNDTLPFLERNEEYGDLAEGHFLLAKIEWELRNRDECLLHMYESQRLAEDLNRNNLLRRLRRMRRNIENEVAETLLPSTTRMDHPAELPAFLSKDPHLKSYLEDLLSDLMDKLSAGYGFVTLYNGGGRRRDVKILARRGISAESTEKLTEWFMQREDVVLSERVLITDTGHDRRTAGIRDLLPGCKAPVFFQPICNGATPLGLFFFQYRSRGDEPPRLGSSVDIAAMYAGFIEFLVRGFSGDGDSSPRRTGSDRKGDFRRIITRNDRMLKVLNLAERVADSDSTVLLMGETGTGKGLIAQAIHRLSPRRRKKFVHVNCAALPETLLESELFGHVKGSFTGAVSDKKGLLAEADGGTVFLDEIGKTSLPLQGKLLQFLDTKQVRPVGSNAMFDVDVRLIFASKVDLLSLCREGRMLEDFYYRINDFPLIIPPLRERDEDIHLLANHCLKLFCEEMGKKALGFTEDAMSCLVDCKWPGNVRELEKVIRRAILLAGDSRLITPNELAFEPEKMGEIPVHNRMNLPQRIKRLEKRVISEALARNQWNRSITARELGISYPTLLKKINDYDLGSIH